MHQKSSYEHISSPNHAFSPIRTAQKSTISHTPLCEKFIFGVAWQRIEAQSDINAINPFCQGFSKA